MENAARRFESTAADEILAPVRALFNTREGHASLARADMLGRAGGDFLQLNVCDSLPSRAKPLVHTGNTTVTMSQLEQGRQRVVSPPLGWLLSKIARDWMDAALNGPVADAGGDCYQRNAYAIHQIADILPRAPDHQGGTNGR